MNVSCYLFSLVFNNCDNADLAAVSMLDIQGQADELAGISTDFPEVVQVLHLKNLAFHQNPLVTGLIAVCTGRRETKVTDIIILGEVIFWFLLEIM